MVLCMVGYIGISAGILKIEMRRVLTAAMAETV
jgi:hypothetical protein